MASPGRGARRHAAQDTDGVSPPVPATRTVTLTLPPGGADGGSALIASTCGPLMNVRGSSSSGLQPPHASATASAVAVAIDRALIRNPPGRPGSAAAASRPADETP